MNFSHRLPIQVAKDVLDANDPEIGAEIIELEVKLEEELSRPGALQDGKKIRWLTDRIRELAINGKAEITEY